MHRIPRWAWPTVVAVFLSLPGTGRSQTPATTPAASPPAAGVPMPTVVTNPTLPPATVPPATVPPATVPPVAAPATSSPSANSAPANSAPANSAPANSAPANSAPASSAATEMPAVAEPKGKQPEAEKPLREQTIYIPYTRLRETFEKEGRGVYLPYEQFQELWRKARLADQPNPDQPPPAGILITEMASEATVERDVVVVRSKLKLEAMGVGWLELPLRLSDSAIRAAQLGDAPARITWNAEQGYVLLVKKDAKEPQSLELSLEYAKGITKSPGLNAASFAAPPAPINRWRIRIPQSGVKVQIEPLIAASEEPAPANPTAPANPAAPGGAANATPPANGAAPSGKDETVLLAFVGAAPEVKIAWTPKSEGATGLEALASAQAQQEVTLEEGVVRTRVRLTYDISRSELSQLRVVLPAQQKVTGVFDPNVRQWDVTAAGEEQTLIIQLFEPAKKVQTVTIELERFSDQFLAEEVAVPVIKAAGVGRQQGVLVVKLGDELRAEPTKRSGLLQVDAGELPESLKSQPWSFAYRYSALPFELSLRVEKVKPRIRSEELVEVYQQPESTTIDWLGLYDIQQAGVFQLELDLPAGYDVRQVRGQAAAGAEALAVDSHSLTGDNKTRLRVNLARKAMGRGGLFVELVKQQADPNLLSPTGQASKLELPLPRTATPLEGTNGRIVVYSPESLRINPDQLTGLRSVSFAEALQGVESQRGDRFPLTREVLAFVYTQEPAALTITAERRKPQVSVRQFLVARIDSGLVKYDATFHYDVQYSSVKTLRIDVPTALAGEIRNVSPGIREKTIDPRPADAAEGYTPWSLTGEREFLGQVLVHFTWETKSSELAIGQSLDYPLPVLQPRETDRAWGQIVVAKAETLDVNPKSGFSGLRPIDPQHDLADGASVADAARAFEFHDNWNLTVTATRYQLEDVKRTSIERAIVRLVVTRSRQVSVQALYRVRSAVQRLAVTLPADSQLDSDSLRLNGRATPLERGDQNELYVPLVNLNPDEPFILELRYTVAGTHERLDFPVFPAQPPVQSEPAMQKVHLLVYLPEELALLGSRGPWTNEQADWYARLNGLPVGQEPHQKLAWVTDGISLQNNPLDSFATDGRVYGFTTIRPSPPPDGSLRLVAWNQNAFHLAMFAGLVVIAVLGLRQSLKMRLAITALAIAAVVFLGVFAPTLSMQLLDPKLVLGMGLVLLLWLVTSVSRAAQARRVEQPPFAANTSATNATATPPVSSSAPTATDSVLAGQTIQPDQTLDAETIPPPSTDAGGSSQSPAGGDHHG